MKVGHITLVKISDIRGIYDSAATAFVPQTRNICEIERSNGNIFSISK